MPRMVECVIDSIRVNLTNQQRVVVLREMDADRYLAIWIGPFEAEAITMALQEIEVARPHTHDLMINALRILNARLVRVEVLSLRDDVFFGNLVVEVNKQLVNIDTRPSDAFALAVRAHVPILVAREVLDAAGITPEQETEEETAEPDETHSSIFEQEDDVVSDEEDTESEADTAGEERLSVFEDFLQNLDLGGLQDSDDEEDTPPSDDPNDPDIPPTPHP